MKPLSIAIPIKILKNDFATDHELARLNLSLKSKFLYKSSGVLLVISNCFSCSVMPLYSSWAIFSFLTTSTD